MQIKRLLTKVNYNKYNGVRNIKYIVIHYTANKGDTALNNAKYFENVDRNSSAHYFVDENEIFQVVDDNDVAWHCGKDYSNGKAPFWNICTNNNSIGIEMCSDYDNSKYYISDDTQKNTIELVKGLMVKYNIPIENIVRHYDVTFKNCPLPFVDNFQWDLFKSKLIDEDIIKAINKLSDLKIIENPEFWKANYNTESGLQYVKDLIIKFANYIDKNN